MKRYIKAEMSYADFQDNYEWSLRKYPDVANLYGRNYIITLSETNYYKSGGRWTEESTTTETVSLEHYMNTIDATPFFKSIGGTEKVQVRAVVGPGYIPVQIESISPDRQEKTVRKFDFKRK